MTNITIPSETIAQFCQRYHIQKLSFFGSVLRDDFSPESDIDILVEFDPQHVPGLIRLSAMEQELSGIFQHKVDLRTPEDLSSYFRQEVIDSALIQYAASITIS
ncbi:putative nucleotidyltransferase [Xenococcus sp. PCC 7305]|uniref:nucleotidyltransferase family protein n=1 Tax=Xenococcus sp. PCC 7305 TaxID=102125 RepID=UPI0002AC720F|nr:nucleotidyltransferase family protein [Xenococcus sp. PCC 7305]ELS03945.1 putative nucleotidyltransferase [Xenococcus sp. PCC 7305]